MEWHNDYNKIQKPTLNYSAAFEMEFHQLNGNWLTFFIECVCILSMLRLAQTSWLSDYLVKIEIYINID